MWNFSSLIANDRRILLEASPPFVELAKSVAHTMRPHCTHVDPCDEVAGFNRIVCCISIDRELFDLFFNSQNGYRGCYFQSPRKGLLANSHLLGLLAPRLVSLEIHQDMLPRKIEQSLLAPSAKCWLAEVGRGFCPECAGEWTAPQDDKAEILNGRWEKGMATNSRYGRRAPIQKQLRVIGAFINEAGIEHVALRKRARAQQIYDHGWS